MAQKSTLAAWGRMPAALPLLQGPKKNMTVGIKNPAHEVP
jgi:hypothetical protein